MRTSLATLLLLLALPAEASVRKLSLGQLSRISETVILAQVVEQSVRRQDKPLKIHTDTTFEIERVIIGVKIEGRVTLSQLGGSKGEGADRMTQKVWGAAKFEQGERVLLFLERSSAGSLVVAGMAQGKFKILKDPKTGEEWASRDLSDIYLVGDSGAVRTFAWIPPDPNHMRLKSLIQLLRRELRPEPLREGVR